MAHDPGSVPLVPGLYEQVVDRIVELRQSASAYASLAITTRPLEAGDSHAVLAEHVRHALCQALAEVTGDDRLTKQVKLVNQIIRSIGHLGNSIIPSVSEPPVLLVDVRPDSQRTTLTKPERPDTPLALGCLLAGTRLDPSLVSQLSKELTSADAVDILCSFIKWSGVRILQQELQTFTQNPRARLRVLTTSYLGATDFKAIEFLRRLPNTEIRVSYDTHRTRLHAKAYLFHRYSNFGTAYVGSANLSNPALTDGLEWTVKVSQYESTHLWNRVTATFESYWQDNEFEPYQETDQRRLEQALQTERSGDRTSPRVFLFDLRPHAFQQEILDRLHAERDIQGRNRHLVVAATGTGKTMIAAFDYRNWSRELFDLNGQRPTLLFVAHRMEILEQALHTFRAVLRDPNFGDLLVSGSDPTSLDHLFVSIQSYHSRSLSDWPADRYSYVVVDEFHHSEAPTYRQMLRYLEPRVLLGLTATPERADGLNPLEYFQGHVSAQIRLPDAINRKLLSPFQYFALSDTANLSVLKWLRGGYAINELDAIYTRNEVRAALVIEKVQEILLNPSKTRALGFCVSVGHADFMADQFRKAGLAAESLSATTPIAERVSAQDRLRHYDLNFLFVVDLYNEGVDIPELDAVLFLRPTESLTVFLQQLGRGLRLHPEKECLTVIDFVADPHRKFRYDRRFRALLTDPATRLADQVEHGFTALPAGCSIVMERVARDRILNNIRQNVRQSRSSLIGTVQELSSQLGCTPSLAQFLDYATMDARDFYRRGVCWSRLLVEAKLREPFHEPDELRLSKGFHRIAHIADGDWIQRLRLLLDPAVSLRDDLPIAPLDDRWLLMLEVSLWAKSALFQSAVDGLRRLESNPTLREELRELLSIKRDTIDFVTPRIDLPFLCPLALHAPYTTQEILSALGRWTRASRPDMREGVLHLPEIRADVLFVTLHKTDKDYSPTTMYEDYAISDQLFHWQSQSTTSADSTTGERYINHTKHGYTILLFGREYKKRSDLAEPFHFLGPATYVSHSGSRPMSITWRLDHPLPARLLRSLARLTVV